MDCVGEIIAYDVVQLFCDFLLPFVDGQLIDGAFLILMETNDAPDYGQGQECGAEHDECALVCMGLEK